MYYVQATQMIIENGTKRPVCILVAYWRRPTQTSKWRFYLFLFLIHKKLTKNRRWKISKNILTYIYTEPKKSMEAPQSIVFKWEISKKKNRQLAINIFREFVFFSALCFFKVGSIFFCKKIIFQFWVSANLAPYEFYFLIDLFSNLSRNGLKSKNKFPKIFEFFYFFQLRVR